MPHHSAAPPCLDDSAHLGAKALDDTRLPGKPIRRLGRVGGKVVELARRIVRAGLDPRRLGEAAGSKAFDQLPAARADGHEPAAGLHHDWGPLERPALESREEAEAVGTGPGAWASVKRMPSAARRSMCGVGILEFGL